MSSSDNTAVGAMTDYMQLDHKAEYPGSGLVTGDVDCPIEALSHAAAPAAAPCFAKSTCMRYIQ